MKIIQAIVSKSIQTFRSEYMEKFNLTQYFDHHLPVVMFGMYEPADYQFYLSHKGSIMVVWCGSDSLMITPERVNILNKRPAKHIVKSKFGAADLQKWNIKYDIIPVSWQNTNYDAIPLGDSIYFYGNGRNNFYGDQYLPEIRHRTRLNIIQTIPGKYPKGTMKEIYSHCFIGLRLTTHDGLPNTVLEMGMMGRRCIYNGDLPNVLRWFGINDICTTIEYENKNRDYINIKKVSSDMKNFINIGTDWLEI